MAKQRTSRKSGKANEAPAAKPAWWLDEGEEECPHCEQTYVYETEVRCTRCDAAICLHCVTRVRKTVLCPECAGSPG